MSKLIIAAAVAVAVFAMVLPAFAADGPHTQVVKQAYGAYAKGNIDGVVSTTADDVDWGGFGGASEGAPYARYTGHDGVRKWFAGLAAETGPYMLSDLHFSEDGDTVTVTGNMAATATATGKQITGPFVHVFRFRGNKIAWFGNYSDSAAYGAATGLGGGATASGGDTQAQANIDLIKQGYAAFAQGDMNTLLNCFTDDITWETVGPADKNPLFGVRTGKGAVAAWFGQVYGLVDPKPFTDVSFVASGDTVVVIGTNTGTYRSTHKTITEPFVHIMKFRGGKVYWFRELTDTYKEVDAYMNK